MAKPKINTRCVANNYASPTEQIAEVSSGRGDGKGCLIAVSNQPDGTLLINVYRIDKGVDVQVSAERS